MDPPSRDGGRESPPMSPFGVIPGSTGLPPLPLSRRSQANSIDDEMLPPITLSVPPSPVTPGSIRLSAERSPNVRGSARNSPNIDEPRRSRGSTSDSVSGGVRSSSRNDGGMEGLSLNTVSLSRLQSKQSAAPAWLTNDVTALGMLTRSVSTPKPPPATPLPVLPDERLTVEPQLVVPAALTEEDSRMLRHLEQHTHLQEEAQAEEFVDPQRSEQIQRENDRLLHIALRRDRTARLKKLSPRSNTGGNGKDRDKGGDEHEELSDEQPSPIIARGRESKLFISDSPRTNRYSDADNEEEYFGKIPQPLTNNRTNSTRSGGEQSNRSVPDASFTRSLSRRDLDDLGFGSDAATMTNSGPASKRAIDVLLSDAQSTVASSPRNVKRPLDESEFFGESASSATHQPLASSGVKLDAPHEGQLNDSNDDEQTHGLTSQNGGNTDASRQVPVNTVAAASTAGGVRVKSFGLQGGKPSPTVVQADSNDKLSQKRPGLAPVQEQSSSGFFGFGFGRRAASSNGINVSSRSRRGFPSSRKRNPSSHLPPSFTGAKQRTKLIELLQKIDLADASLMDALRKIKPLHPMGMFRRRWDKLLALAVMYTLVVVPYEVAFAGDDIVLRIIGIVLDVMFILDVVLQFRTSYKEVNDEYVRDFNQIAKNYVRTWFFLDLIAAIPVNLITFIVSLNVNATVDEYFSLFKLVKVFRVVRLRHLFYSLAGLKVSVFIYLLMLISAFVLSAHWFACIFWKIGWLENDAGVNNWITLNTAFPDLLNKSISEQYSSSMYWSVSTISTLGYGDIRPRSHAEQIFSLFVIILGATLYAAVIGLVSYIVRSQYDSELQRQNHADSVRTFGRHYNLPPPLQKRIQQYYDFLWERKKRFSSKSLVDDLPLELRADVADAIHKKLIEMNPVLRSCNTLGFKKVFAARLSSSVVRLPEDVLYFEGDPVTDVFFIKKGMVEIVFGLDRGPENEFVVARRSEGQHLGDMGLFIESVDHTADVVGSRQRNNMNAIDEEEEDSEEEAEFSPADHFNLNQQSPEQQAPSPPLNSQNTSKNASNQLKRRQLHHTSAVVVEMSEISSILASDFLQLLEIFPKEKMLFKSVAEARFKRVRDLVSTRLRLVVEQQEHQMEVEAQEMDARLQAAADFDGSDDQEEFEPTVGDLPPPEQQQEQEQQQPPPPLLKRLPSLGTLFRSDSSIPSERSLKLVNNNQLEQQALTVQQAPVASPQAHMAQALTSTRRMLGLSGSEGSGPSEMGGSSPANNPSNVPPNRTSSRANHGATITAYATFVDRVLAWKRNWQIDISAERDDELVSQTVQRALQVLSASLRSPLHPRSILSRKKSLKASEMLLSPQMINKKAAQGDPFSLTATTSVVLSQALLNKGLGRPVSNSIPGEEDIPQISVLGNTTEPVPVAAVAAPSPPINNSLENSPRLLRPSLARARSKSETVTIVEDPALDAGVTQHRRTPSGLAEMARSSSSILRQASSSTGSGVIGDTTSGDQQQRSRRASLAALESPILRGATSFSRPLPINTNASLVGPSTASLVGAAVLSPMPSPAKGFKEFSSSPLAINRRGSESGEISPSMVNFQYHHHSPSAGQQAQSSPQLEKTLRGLLEKVQRLEMEAGMMMRGGGGGNSSLSAGSGGAAPNPRGRNKPQPSSAAKTKRSATELSSDASLVADPSTAAVASPSVEAFNAVWKKRSGGISDVRGLM